VSEVGKPKEKITITPKVEPVPQAVPMTPAPVEVPQEQPVEPVGA
jgi:hypothetical protein